MRALCSGASAPVTISIPCEIKYELDGGTNHADNPASYTVESGAITLKNPERGGHSFGGWYETADFSGDAVTGIPANSTGRRPLREVESDPLQHQLRAGRRDEPRKQSPKPIPLKIRSPSQSGSGGAIPSTAGMKPPISAATP